MTCVWPVNPRLQISAGALRHRVTIQQRTRTPDGAGGFTETWAAQQSTWASIEPKTGMEAIIDGQMQTIGRTKVRMRYVAGLTNANRLTTADGTIYNIREVLDIDFRHVVHELTCDEGASNG